MCVAHALLRTVAGGLAGAMLLTACGQGWSETGRVVSADDVEVCAAFSNGQTTCFSRGLEHGEHALFDPGDCVKVEFAGESAEILGFRRRDCPSPPTVDIGDTLPDVPT